GIPCDPDGRRPDGDVAGEVCRRSDAISGGAGGQWPSMEHFILRQLGIYLFNADANLPATAGLSDRRHPGYHFPSSHTYYAAILLFLCPVPRGKCCLCGERFACELGIEAGTAA